MFNNCTSLNKIEVGFDDWNANEESTTSWVRNVSSSGTFTCLYTLPQTYGSNNIPSGWTVSTIVNPPKITFDDGTIEIACDIQNAEIYYKIGQASSFTRYTQAIQISSDTTIQAYSKIGDLTSEIVEESFQYDDGIEEPVIMCDGEQVEITCETMGADIYYRIGGTGSFTSYLEPFDINATVVVEAYSIFGNKQSQTVS
jgi:hypothetical protein